MNSFMDRKHFEKEYEPNQQKSPFPYFQFNEETQLYESYEPLLDQDRVALLNASWLGWQSAMKKISSKDFDFALYPKQLTEDTKTALSYMCFDLIKVAQVYRDLGYEIPKKAEEEQAFFLHRFLLLAIEYGGDFIKVFNEQTHTLVELKAAK